MAKAKKAKRDKVPAYVSRDTSVSSAVADAFSGAEELKDELQSWYDNLHENFQNGTKGEELNEAIGTLEGLTQPDVPTDIELENVSYSERSGRKGQSRAARRDTLASMLQAAADHARQRSSELGELEYDEDGEPKEGPASVGNPPDTEEARDELVQDLDTFADECESAVSDLEGVEFPGMY